MGLLKIAPTDGDVVHVTPGDVVEVHLPENPTTGYRWAVEAKPDLVEQVDASEPPSSLGAPGAGTTRVLAFRVCAAGEEPLRLRLARAWEREKPPVERLTLTIVSRS